jgi:hypothetical protein
MTETTEFWQRWLAFVRAYTTRGPQDRERLVRTVLGSGLVPTLADIDVGGASEG